mmetsp:Transcript_2748/g.3959  ORF Transcript_2748/g.3959 Transcript_2748/m.3959 type:complete len:218 (+) Transcript_2748:55-708(+)
MNPEEEYQINTYNIQQYKMRNYTKQNNYEQQKQQQKQQQQQQQQIYYSNMYNEENVEKQQRYQEEENQQYYNGTNKQYEQRMQLTPQQHINIEIETERMDHPYYSNSEYHGIGSRQQDEKTWKKQGQNQIREQRPPHDMDQSIQELSPTNDIQRQRYYEQEDINRHQEYLRKLKQNHPRMRRRSALPMAITNDERMKLRHFHRQREMEEAFKSFKLS